MDLIAGGVSDMDSVVYQGEGDVTLFQALFDGREIGRFNLIP
jgi:hypothetical protein